MKCIFCKQDSSSSISIEHIIPESLGNKEHALDRGIVCDKCNNYFARKVEKPLLEENFFRSVRSRKLIESKKGKIPTTYGIMGGRVEIQPSKDSLSILIEDETIVQRLINGQIKHMLIPFVDQPESESKTLSRFLAKVALEVLALRLKSVNGWNEEIVDKKELDPLRHYARTGSYPDFWEYHQRRIYPEDQKFVDESILSQPYEVLHELDLIYTGGSEMFLVLAILGVEFAINFTNPNISSYKSWLIRNNNLSKLEMTETRRKVRTV